VREALFFPLSDVSPTSSNLCFLFFCDIILQWNMLSLLSVVSVLVSAVSAALAQPLAYQACGNRMAGISIDGQGNETGPTCALDEVCCFHVQPGINEDSELHLGISCVAGGGPPRATEEQCHTCANGYGGLGTGKCHCEIRPCGSRRDDNGILEERGGNLSCIVCGPGPFCASGNGSAPEDCDSPEAGWTWTGFMPVPFVLAAGVVAVSIWRRRDWCSTGIQIGFLIPLLVVSLVMLGFPSFWPPRILLAVGFVLLVVVATCAVVRPRRGTSGNGQDTNGSSDFRSSREVKVDVEVDSPLVHSGEDVDNADARLRRLIQRAQAANPGAIVGGADVLPQSSDLASERGTETNETAGDGSGSSSLKSQGNSSPPSNEDLSQSSFLSSYRESGES
jgi:hypothetical protein